MSIAEEVRRVLLEHPEIIAEALEARPEVLYRALAKLMPWQNLATKEDVRSLREEIQRIEEKMATKDDLKHLATKDDVSRLEERLEETRREMATKEEVKALEAKMATKEDLKAFATKEDLKTLEARVATKDDLKALATREELRALEERVATREDVRRLEEQLGEVRKVMATRDDLKAFATKEDVRRLGEQLEEVRKVMTTKEDLKGLATKEELKALEERMATKRDVEELWRAINRLERKLDALGARWGVISEEAFREGMRAMLREAGWSVSKEILYDREGYVYGTPSEVDYDVVVRDGRLIIVEITSSLKRSDLPTIVKKRELYERARGAKVAAVYIVTPYIDDRYPERVKAMAKDLGLEVVYPTPPQE
ncbi:Protein of unknown function DUF1626 [Pyrobaculum islandicum DSM 4184]|uniref:DUF3782 domain-containing protein n=1 Tax=Pyrobaculum islandicum (strain DSM 4184 / JCM 9189 / GEO3) TaxID=384616 RepID=A1RVZ2_PYRIL|nr:DUF3782 domain-containing protein [Pyrobaculum islandicum]ABL89124.1 Protein of unknown function DUF1626 [Pyrobaculum islandicum DSM 4184]